MTVPTVLKRLSSARLVLHELFLLSLALLTSAAAGSDHAQTTIFP